MDINLNFTDKLRVNQSFHPKGVFVDFKWHDVCLEASFPELQGWVLCIYKVGNSIYNLTFPSAEYYEDWIESADSDYCKEGELIYTNYKN